MQDTDTQNTIGLNFEFCESTIPSSKGVSNGAAAPGPPRLIVPFAPLVHPARAARWTWGPSLAFAERMGRPHVAARRCHETRRAPTGRRPAGHPPLDTAVPAGHGVDRRVLPPRPPVQRPNPGPAAPVRYTLMTVYAAGRSA